MSHALPQSFRAKKAKILSDLAVPDSSYSDKSPKGSVDEPIRDLIDLINSHPGWCTTSSCSGRVAVFVEGPKTGAGHNDRDDGEVTSSKVKSGPGGKGGGRWLFVSHKPISVEDRHQFGLSNEALTSNVPAVSSARLVNLTFSPLILHVLCATLHDAKPLVAAAINAGFRESGVQSLKAIEDPEAGVQVAIRTAGIAFSSMVGIVEDGIEEVITRIVGDEYLQASVQVANERFRANDERRTRLEEELKRIVQAEHDFKGVGKAEGKAERRKRKREEGLRRQQESKSTDVDAESQSTKDDDGEIVMGVLDIV